MTDWSEHRSAEDFLITVPLPDGYRQSIKAYHEDPFVAEAVEVYARMNDMDIDDVLEGRNGGAVSVGAPLMGASVIAEAVRMQEMIDAKERADGLDAFFDATAGA